MACGEVANQSRSLYDTKHRLKQIAVSSDNYAGLKRGIVRRKYRTLKINKSKFAMEIHLKKSGMRTTQNEKREATQQCTDSSSCCDLWSLFSVRTTATLMVPLPSPGGAMVYWDRLACSILSKIGMILEHLVSGVL